MDKAEALAYVSRLFDAAQAGAAVWANQYRQNEPPDPANAFVLSNDGADKTNQYGKTQPKNKQHPHHQSVTVP